MARKWRITSADGGYTSSDLVGCRIKETATGYDFTKRNNDLLASTTSTTLPFSFTDFPYDGRTWTVTVRSLGDPATGSWENGKKEEEGSWAAGATIDEEGEEAAAATQ
jgi:hypothetical protein